MARRLRWSWRRWRRMGLQVGTSAWGRRCPGKGRLACGLFASSKKDGRASHDTPPFAKDAKDGAPGLWGALAGEQAAGFYVLADEVDGGFKRRSRSEDRSEEHTS